MALRPNLLLTVYRNTLYVYMMFDVNIIVMQFVDISWVAMKDKS